VHSFDLTRKMLEKGLKITQIQEPTWGTDSSTGAIHNFDNRSDRYVISHKELFLGHFNYTPRNRRKIVSLTAEEALSNFEERLLPLLEAQAQAEAKRCMSCGQCFECDNCVVYCPQTAVFKVKKSQSTTGPLCRHRLQQVHRLPHLQGRLPHGLHPDGTGRVGQRAPPPQRPASKGGSLACFAGRYGAFCRACRPHAAARHGRACPGRHAVRGAGRTDAAQAHGLSEAPARRHRARRRARCQAQPEGLHRLPRQRATAQRGNQAPATSASAATATQP
jgi:hypothetical protein